MEMERINENTIRVLVDNDDLSARGITILDLLGNHQQIEDFFYSILKEVDTEHQFQNNDAVTFQVMPTNDGLELFISKNDSNLAGDEQHRPVNDQVAQYIKQQLAQKRNENDQRKTAVVDDQPQPVNQQPAKWKVVSFANFEDLVAFAHITGDADILSALYKYDGQYYLAIGYGDLAENDSLVKDHLALAYEYGNPTATTVDFLSEHANKIMDVSALHLIRHYFQ
ncbi:adaptor protein MecA [Limosilactobacillus caccae]|jgi:adapter protein MecA 1/2|uniref:adaptor protein MecA n=1 Tax=Limosilactobacillus caccae TaxID=1926284 RepID=UPI0009710291|nr:adaptor protein MecA [Limosilactobacillus caccae]